MDKVLIAGIALFIALGLIVFAVAFHEVNVETKWCHDHQLEFRAGDRSPDLCYDPDTGQVYIPLI